jgi:hypothetical protein
MNHMIADSREELLSMARRIGVQMKWIQHEGEWNEHFDVCDSMRMKAISCGAIPVTTRELFMKIAERRQPRANNE